jgi:tRNA nucleotidyltransferase (CCA-adding enzyme)
MLVAKYHTRCHEAMQLRPGTLLKVLQNVDAFRRPERFDQFLLACEVDARGRKGLENRDYPQAERLRTAYDAARTVPIQSLVQQGFKGPALNAAIREARLRAITKAF